MSLTEMQIACNKIIDIYHKYSGHSKDSDTDTLDKKEFRKMIDEQFPNCVTKSRDPKAIDALFKELDKDKDRRITFEEFMGLLAKFLICTHDRFHQKHGDHPPHSHPH